MTDSEYNEHTMRLIYRIPRRFVEQITGDDTTVTLL